MRRMPSQMSGTIRKNDLSHRNSSHQVLSNKSKDFEAIRQLKQAQNQLDMMKRRLSALKIKDEKNNRKAEAAMNKIRYHSFIQELQQQQREKKERYKQDVNDRIEKRRSLNSLERSQRKANLQLVRKQHKESKQKNYNEEKKAAKQIEGRIKQLNQREMDSRRRMRANVKNCEQQTKNNLKLYQLERHRAIRNYRQAQQSRMIQMQEKRQVQMQELARLEIQMLQRQSRSRQAMEDTTRQLNNLISPRGIKRSRIDTTVNSSQSNPQEHF